MAVIDALGIEHRSWLVDELGEQFRSMRLHDELLALADDEGEREYLLRAVPVFSFGVLSPPVEGAQ